ncbi:uncharacterized protein LOC116348182, partial [Contarinia nasturtii]|uniref:uncharacterized protein LOC116348182 n=1 Tax=Contarinia nasturtii TaxID=265458 RepID=UPI0012D4B31F
CIQKRFYKTSLANYLLDALQAREETIFNNPFMTCAIYLDPRFRNQITSNFDKTEEAKRMFYDLWQRVKYRFDREQTDQQQNETQPDMFFEFNGDDELDKLGASINNGTAEFDANGNCIDIEAVLDKYQPDILSSKNSVLEFWEASKDTHPELYELAMMIYSVPPAEVQIEIDFSHLNHVFNLRRGQLQTERLKDIMFIHLNPDLFYLVKADELKVAFEKVQNEESQ